MKVLACELPEVAVAQVSEGSIQVTLTLHEAAFLRALLGRVGGEPQKTPRCYADNIRRGLREAAVPVVFEVFGGPGIFATCPLKDFDNAVSRQVKGIQL